VVNSGQSLRTVVICSDVSELATPQPCYFIPLLVTATAISKFVTDSQYGTGGSQMANLVVWPSINWLLVLSIASLLELPQEEQAISQVLFPLHHSHKGLFRKFNIPHHLHSLLSFLLFVQQLHLPADVTTIL
jgi:hypothetical protein